MATRKKSRTKAKARPKAKERPRPGKPPTRVRTRARPGSAGTTPAAAARTLPAIEVDITGGRRLRLADLKGKNVVLYFYPKDDTPGCTREGCDVRDRYADVTRRDTVVLGVSRASLASHEKFKARYGFPFELASDPDEKLCKAFGVIKEKSLYGRKYLGVERSTFVFDRAGRLRKEFRGVKVTGHIDEILNELDKL